MNSKQSYAPMMMYYLWSCSHVNSIQRHSQKNKIKSYMHGLRQ